MAEPVSFVVPPTSLLTAKRYSPHAFTDDEYARSRSSPAECSGLSSQPNEVTKTRRKCAPTNRPKNPTTHRENRHVQLLRRFRHRQPPTHLFEEQTHRYSRSLLEKLCCFEGDLVEKDVERSRTHNHLLQEGAKWLQNGPIPRQIASFASKFVRALCLCGVYVAPLPSWGRFRQPERRSGVNSGWSLFVACNRRGTGGLRGYRILLSGSPQRGLTRRGGRWSSRSSVPQDLARDADDLWRRTPAPLPHGTNSKFVGGKEGGACLKGCRAMSLPNCPPLVRGVGGVGVIGMARVVVGVAGRGSRFAIGGGGLGYWDRNQSRRSSNLLVSRSSSVRLGRRTMRRRMPSDLHRWNTTTTWWGTRVEDHEQLRQDHRRRGDDVASSGAGVITGPR